VSGPAPATAIVTGAFGFTGRAIARRLLGAGWRVRTLTGLPAQPSPFGARVPAVRYRFDDPAALAESLAGASVLFNTYWVRFPRRGMTFATAVAHSEMLVRAAARAGVGRIVHVSVSHPGEDSPLAYFRGKAAVEKIIAGSGLSYAILRPTIVFGRGDILINNIAWFLRRFPFFAVPGPGSYRVQPIFVDDLARAAVDAASRENEIVDCAGPEVFTFDELVAAIALALGRPARLIHVSPRAALVALGVIGAALRDVVLTREEIAGLMAGLLVAGAHPAAQTRFSDWLAENGTWLGRKYASELGRHFRRQAGAEKPKLRRVPT
jgi:uncharacterized protein YbjT (DUF2867 family)